MKSILELTRNIFITAGVLSFLVLTFVVKSDGLTGTEDLLGFTIPQPPQFTTFIPYLGYVIGIFFEMLSLHGIVTILVPLALIGAGMKIDKYIEEERVEKPAQKYFEKSALEMQKELENTFYEKRSEDQSFAHTVNANQISEGGVPDTCKVTLPKTGSVEEMHKRLQTPEAKERLAERLINHLIRVGQIKVSPEEAEKLSPEGKKALGEYLERTGQVKDKVEVHQKKRKSEVQLELEEYQRKQRETAEVKSSKELSPAGKEALLEYARKTGLIKE